MASVHDVILDSIKNNGVIQQSRSVYDLLNAKPKTILYFLSRCEEYFHAEIPFHAILWNYNLNFNENSNEEKLFFKVYTVLIRTCNDFFKNDMENFYKNKFSGTDDNKFKEKILQYGGFFSHS